VAYSQRQKTANMAAVPAVEPKSMVKRNESSCKAATVQPAAITAMTVRCQALIHVVHAVD